MRVFLVLLLVGYATTAPQTPPPPPQSLGSVNNLNDNMGNFDASIQSNQGSGNIVQGSDGNNGGAKYTNSVAKEGNGTIDVNAIAGNEQAVLNNDSQQATIKQLGDGNQDDNTILNQMIAGMGDSVNDFNVANMDARTQNAKGDNMVGQVNDNNNATNNFVNN